MRPKIVIWIVSGIFLVVAVAYYEGREYVRAREAERRVERTRLLKEVQVLEQEKHALELELERGQSELQHQNGSESMGDFPPPCRKAKPGMPCLDKPPPQVSP